MLSFLRQLCARRPASTGDARPVRGVRRKPIRRQVRPTLERLEQRELLSGPGSFDPTFGNGGRTNDNFEDILGPNATVSATALQSDGKIVVAGTVSPDSNNDYFAVVRLNSDGSLDQSFGLGGRQYFTFSDLLGNGHDSASAVAVDPQGRIVIAGTALADGSNGVSGDVFAVGRLNADGSFDTSFGLGGRQYFTFSDLLGGSVDTTNAVAIDPQGRIVLAGTALTGGGYDFAVGRLNDDGSFDTSFGLGGRQYFTFSDLLGSSFDFADALAIDPQGRIVIAGTAYTGAANNGGDFAVGRLNDDGSFDTSFGLGGRQYFTFSDLLGGSFDFADALAIDPQGRLVIAGTAYTDAAHGGGHDFAVGRLNDDGSFDTSFGLGGRQYFTFSDLLGGTNDTANAVAIDSQGHIVLAGYASADAAHGGGNDFAAGRLNDDGSFDTSFGLSGRQYLTFSDLLGGNNDVGNAMVLDAQDNVVIAGTANKANGNTDMAVTRLLGN